MKATIILEVELDHAWVEREGQRRNRDKPVEQLVSLLEGRSYDSVRHVDGVLAVAVTSAVDSLDEAPR